MRKFLFVLYFIVGAGAAIYFLGGAAVNLPDLKSGMDEAAEESAVSKDIVENGEGLEVDQSLPQDKQELDENQNSDNGQNEKKDEHQNPDQESVESEKSEGQLGEREEVSQPLSVAPTNESNQDQKVEADLPETRPEISPSPVVPEVKKSAESVSDSNSEGAVPPTYLDIDPVPSDRFEALQTSIFDDRAFDYPSGLNISFDTALKSGQEWGEWRENFLNIIAHIETVVLKFELKQDYVPQGDQANSFALNITFEERPIMNEVNQDRNGGRKAYTPSYFENFAVTARHSIPRITAQAGGVRLRVLDTKQIRYFLEGEQKAGVVIVVPKGKITAPRGLMVCTRDFNLARARSGVKEMEDTGYELVGVDFVVHGVAEGRVTTGFGPGVAEALVHTTSNIPVAKVAYDFAKSVFPFASVEYLPPDGRVLPLSVRGKEVTGGLLSRVVLHNSLNHKAVTEALTRLTVKKLDVVTGFAVTRNKDNFKVMPGDCYGIIKETIVKHMFSKEKLLFDDNQNDKSLEELVEDLGSDQDL